MGREDVRELAQDFGPIAAMAVAWAALLGSLYFSEVRGFAPCELCWYQRILMYPLALVTLVGVVRNDESLPVYVLPFSVLGMGVSGYHYLIQLGVFGQTNACTVGVPCNLRYVEYGGFVTIPFMALTAFVLITVSMVVVRWASPRENGPQMHTD